MCRNHMPYIPYTLQSRNPQVTLHTSMLCPLPLICLKSLWAEKKQQQQIDGLTTLKQTKWNHQGNGGLRVNGVQHLTLTVMAIGLYLGVSHSDTGRALQREEQPWRRHRSAFSLRAACPSWLPVYFLWEFINREQKERGCQEVRK